MIRKRLNPQKLGNMGAAPGNDPRIWVTLARVDDDPDAIRWAEPEDGPVGWVVDVTIQGGPSDQEGPIPCRLGASFASPGGMRSEPIARGCLVVVLVQGNLNEECTIIAHLPTEGCAPPTSVNGTELTEEYALANHWLVTPHGVDEQVGGDRRVAAAGKHSLHGETLELGAANAGQAFVRGDDLEGALSDFADALNTVAIAVGAGLTAITPAGGGPAIGTTFATALTQFQTSVAAFKASSLEYKSTRIKGE